MIDERRVNEIESPEHEDEKHIEETVVPEVEAEPEPRGRLRLRRV